MALEVQIRNILEPAFNDLGYDLVQVLIAGGQNMRLALTIDKLDGTQIVIEDCVRATKEASAILDVEDPIKGEYDLEISSPGFDRPLTRPKDFMRFQGEPLKLETSEPVEGRKRFKGNISKADETGIVVALSEALPDGTVSVSLSYEQIARAKLDPVY